MNIIVTGASKGIGRELVKQLAQTGDHNILAVSRNAEGLNDLANECSSDRVDVKPIDITTPEGIKAIGDWADERQQIDIVVNNAGILINKKLEDLSNEDINAMYSTNVFAVISLLRRLSPLLGISSTSQIINIGSMGGVQGSAKFPGLSAYSSSKAALACLTECLAEEWKDRDIHINYLALGAVQTEMLAEAFPGYEAPFTSQQMAGYIKDFCLSGGKFYNGKVLPVSVSTP